MAKTKSEHRIINIQLHRPAANDISAVLSCFGAGGHREGVDCQYIITLLKGGGICKDAVEKLIGW